MSTSSKLIDTLANDDRGRLHEWPAAYARAVGRPAARQRRAPRPYQDSAGRCRNLWVVVSHLIDHDGRPVYVTKDTRGSARGACPMWTDSPREARQFRSRQAAHQFARRVDFDHVGLAFPINLARYGFAG